VVKEGTCPPPSHDFGVRRRRHLNGQDENAGRREGKKEVIKEGNAERTKERMEGWMQRRKEKTDGRTEGTDGREEV
jgi:hypothetical protein